MLTDKEINSIIKKERLDKNDIYLITHHIEEIKKMNQDYPEGVPADVYNNTQNDLKKIIKRLQEERDLIKQDINQDLEEKKKTIKREKKKKEPFKLRLVDKEE